jgi:hypothetical protein
MKVIVMSLVCLLSVQLAAKENAHKPNKQARQKLNKIVHNQNKSKLLTKLELLSKNAKNNFKNIKNKKAQSYIKKGFKKYGKLDQVKYSKGLMTAFVKGAQIQISLKSYMDNKTII